MSRRAKPPRVAPEDEEEDGAAALETSAGDVAIIEPINSPHLTWSPERRDLGFQATLFVSCPGK
jgi:hypothetical protein